VPTAVPSDCHAEGVSFDHAPEPLAAAPKHTRKVKGTSGVKSRPNVGSMGDPTSHVVESSPERVWVDDAETGERRPGVLGAEGDKFVVIKSRRPPALTGRWAAAPLGSFHGMATADVSPLALRLLLLLVSMLRLGDGNIVRLSAGDAADELGIAAQRSRIRKAFRELSAEGLVLPLPSSSNRTGKHLINPDVIWAGDRNERMECIENWRALMDHYYPPAEPLPDGAASVDPATGVLLDVDGDDWIPPATPLELVAGEVDRGAFIDVPLPLMLDVDPLADWDPGLPPVAVGGASGQS
jgi:hypothetical protein